MKKKYTNLIILGLILIAAAVYLVIKFVNFNQILLTLGYYDSKIKIANTADVHGHMVYDDETGTYYTLDEVSTIMGLPLLNSFVKEERAKDENTLLLDCGDLFHGSNEANINDGEGVVECVNLMGYDAMVPGNHDFNFGFDRLLEIRSEINFPILSANVYKDGKQVFDEYKIFEVNGKKIGVFGLTTPFSTNFVHDNTITFDDPAKCAKRVVSELKGKVDAIVLLSHLGDDNDERLIQEVDGIDLLLCGHYHYLYESVKKINNTYMAEAGSFTTHLGVADMYFKDGKVAKVDWKVKTTTDRSKEDAELKKVADIYHEKALESAKIKVGSSDVVLNGIRTQVRSKETNLANLLADSMREKAGADLTLMNGGGIRESLPQGELNMYQIGKMLPFVNSLVVVEMKGDMIYKALERGLRGYPTVFNGGFLQVSGISYVIDASKIAGERLVSVTKDGAPLDKEKTYKVATNDYLFYGGDGYEEIQNSKLLSTYGLLKDVLADYIKSKGTVSPVEDGRIKIINERYK
ncbi:bifunctional metallophosphatase/5'-nucleotidase [Ruminiclostridium herbifermentans]|uniref:Bifunctional metallophosphatase/5'-nucleotidase n=1 Tax=Ruminiclostridium herbifermentans TaxID=2488810 RepID=A0A4U7JHI9_9FIRM|nr:bifunctional UDP-sugar hydrolase/5'-nucleotidase [Ruminiclostridium herbifermentans]QNU66170.1 bifunctional metallophosphatase/5'-nucleotidase [Ruminiclostridium herbifermentans]